MKAEIKGGNREGSTRSVQWTEPMHNSTEQVSALIWSRRRSIKFFLSEIGILLSCRWQCKKFIRAHNAYVGVQNGVNSSLNLTMERMSYRTVDCHAELVFDW